MSSNAEQVPNAGTQAMAEEALLKEIGRRAPSPTQAVKVCRILGLASRENIRRVRELAKNKNEVASKAENKKSEEKMEIEWGGTHYAKKVCTWIEKAMQRALQKEKLKVQVTGSWARYNSEDGDSLIYLGVKEDSFYNNSAQMKYFGSLYITVYRKEFLALAKRLARACEKRTGQNILITKAY